MRMFEVTKKDFFAHSLHVLVVVLALFAAPCGAYAQFDREVTPPASTNQPDNPTANPNQVGTTPPPPPAAPAGISETTAKALIKSAIDNYDPKAKLDMNELATEAAAQVEPSTESGWMKWALLAEGVAIVILFL